MPSACPRATALLVLSLCLVALQYLPFHVLAEHHHGGSHPHETAGTAPLHHEDDSPLPAHPVLDHHSGAPAPRSLSSGTDLFTIAAFVFAPNRETRLLVGLIQASVPPSPDIGPLDARGPPRRDPIA